MRLARYVGNRLLLMIPLVLGITFATYAIVNFVPGSPLAQLEMNPRIRAADIEQARQNLGLDKPWHLRYFIWLGNVARGDLGVSFNDSTNVADRILGVLPNTLLLTSTSLILALSVSIPLGVISAVRRRSVVDHIVTVGAMAAYAVPSFWLAFLLIILFGVKFREWGIPGLPVSGTHDVRDGGDIVDRAQHLILPAVSLALVELAGWTRYIRSSMLEVLHTDYVRTARSKGLKERTVLYAHAFRNAALPLITFVGMSLPALFGGAFVTEAVFAWNGMGLLAVNAARANDYPMIMGISLVVALLTLVGTLIADVLYAVVDPRVAANPKQ